MSIDAFPLCFSFKILASFYHGFNFLVCIEKFIGWWGENNIGGGYYHATPGENNIGGGEYYHATPGEKQDQDKNCSLHSPLHSSIYHIILCRGRGDYNDEL